MISAEEREAVLELPLSLKTYDADQVVVEDGDSPRYCFFVISGFLCSYTTAWPRCSGATR